MGLALPQMLFHIPKTGGTTIQASMRGTYGALFNTSRPYRQNATRCPSTTSKWHLTPAELKLCRFKVPDGPALCVVRDPVDRFLSEVGYRAIAISRNQLKMPEEETIPFWKKSFISRGRNHVSPENTCSRQVSVMIDLCKSATPMSPFDVYSHCQPQANYLYYSNGSSTCDYLLANITRHHKLLHSLLNLTSELLPRLNSSPEIPNKWALSTGQSKWVHDFYKRDFDDINIAAALSGKVLTRSGTIYTPIFMKRALHLRAHVD